MMVRWPNLEKINFVSEKPATEEDVAQGRAVFFLESEGEMIGSPLPIPLPQYAYHTNTETKERTPCILIQAEEANGQQIGGCISVVDGTFLVALMDELELYGKNVPQE